MNFLGKLFGDDFGEQAKTRVNTICSLSWPALVFFSAGRPPCAQQIQTGPWESWKRPSKQVYTLSPKRRMMGKARLSKPGKQEVTKGTIPEQDLSQKELTQLRLTSNQILQFNPLLLIHVSPQTSIHYKIPIRPPLDLQPDTAIQPPPPNPCLSPDEYPL